MCVRVRGGAGWWCGGVAGGGDEIWGLDLRREENHISPQVNCTRLGSVRLGSARLCSAAAGSGGGSCGVFPVMLGAVKMEGHEAPEWGGYYGDEVSSSCLCPPVVPSGGPDGAANPITFETTKKKTKTKFGSEFSF